MKQWVCLKCGYNMIGEMPDICPFCGATFARFPSGVQRFLQRFSQKTLSFDAFIRIVLAASGFGLIWFFAGLGVLPTELEALGIFGCIIFIAFGLAELFYQTIEMIAGKLSHDSSSYWWALALLAILISYLQEGVTGYIVFFSLLMTIRWLIAGFAAAKNSSN